MCNDDAITNKKFGRIMNTLINNKSGLATVQLESLRASRIKTPLGTMIAIADKAALFHLKFEDQIDLPISIITGSTPAIISITSELEQYFQGTLTQFKTPIHMNGTAFQNSVWDALIQIPFGHTRSYAEIAHVLGKPTAFRAAANANGANALAIIIPCHRVINTDGKLGGYNGGIERKKWLLAHERKHYCPTP